MSSTISEHLAESGEGQGSADPKDPPSSQPGGREPPNENEQQSGDGEGGQDGSDMGMTPGGGHDDDDRDGEKRDDGRSTSGKSMMTKMERKMMMMM